MAQDKRRSTTNQHLIEGKMPPQAIELEEAVLGAIMLEPCINELISILTPESFYKDAHARLYAAIVEMFRNSHPINILTVTQELKKTGELEIVGGAYYITQLTNRIASAANVEFHARIIQQKFIQRELIRISTKTINDAYDDSSDVFDLLDASEKSLFEITKNIYKKEQITASKLANKVIKELENIIKRPDGLSGIPSGLQELDKIIGGWQNSDLIIIAARPAMGKSALAVTLAANASLMFNIPTALFSLEMSESQIMKRFISFEAEVDSYIFKNPKAIEDYHWELINRAVGNISNAPLFIDDTPSLSIMELRAKARRLSNKNSIKLIIIDYLQLMTGDATKGNREQEIASISRNLKALAKELNIPIIALSQLSRAVEGRGGDKKPQLSDLRESGAIEQDADIVIFPHRPEYYGVIEDGSGNSTVGKGELIVAKHREGRTDTAIVSYYAKYTKFCDLANFQITHNPNKGIEANREWENQSEVKR
jgi:replicative DNA helicase